MNNQFIKNISKLKSLKQNFTSEILFYEDDVKLLNEILDSLGSDFDDFKIKSYELKQEVTSWNQITKKSTYSHPRIHKKNFFQKLDAAINYLESKHKEKEMIFSEQILSSIFYNFPEFINQLKRRYGNREPINIKDEYDVQDILHAIFKLFFDDVRKEENTPSFAGRSSRIDFSIPDEKIIIEVKHTRKNLQDKQIGDEITNDITHYTSFEKYENFYVFIYDPQKIIENSIGLKKDLEQLTFKDKTIRVFISN